MKLCDEGNGLFAEYEQQEKLIWNRMETAKEPFELTEEFYQATENYIDHVDTCKICKGQSLAYMRITMFGKAVDELVEPIKQSLDRIYKEFERILEKATK